MLAGANPSLPPNACAWPQVVVTGAGGRTGALVVKKLLERKDKFDTIATVRSKSSGSKLVASGLPESALFEFDLAAAAAARCYSTQSPAHNVLHLLDG